MKLRLFTVALISAFSASTDALRLAQDAPKEEKSVELNAAGGDKHCVSFGDAKPTPAGCCDDDRPLAVKVQEGIDKQKKRCEDIKLWPTGGAAAAAATAPAAAS